MKTTMELEQVEKSEMSRVDELAFVSIVDYDTDSPKLYGKFAVSADGHDLYIALLDQEILKVDLMQVAEQAATQRYAERMASGEPDFPEPKRKVFALVDYFSRAKQRILAEREAKRQGQLAS